MLPVGYSEELIKDEVNKAILKGFDLAIEDLDTAKNNFEARISVFDVDSEQGTLTKALNEFKDSCLNEAIKWLETSRDELIIGIIDDESDEN